MSAFQLQPTESGTGGFELVGESSQPIYDDLNSDIRSRDELLGDAARHSSADCRIYSFRVRPGDDASCGNLYRPNQPRILGVPLDFRTHFGHLKRQSCRVSISSKSAARTDFQQEYNPWQLLADESHASRRSRSRWSSTRKRPCTVCKLYRGIGEEFTFTLRRPPDQVPRRRTPVAEHPAWQPADLRIRLPPAVPVHQRLSLLPDRCPGCGLPANVARRAGRPLE